MSAAQSFGKAHPYAESLLRYFAGVRNVKMYAPTSAVKDLLALRAASTSESRTTRRRSRAWSRNHCHCASVSEFVIAVSRNGQPGAIIAW
jgi:hypothetical protein